MLHIEDSYFYFYKGSDSDRKIVGNSQSKGVVSFTPSGFNCFEKNKEMYKYINNWINQ